MTDETPDTVLDDDELSALQARPLTDLSVDELMAMKAAYAARGIRIVNSVPWEVVAPLLAASAIYSKAFLETLGKHNAEWVIDKVQARIRRKGETREVLVGPDDGAAAMLVVTSDTPDEARLAVLDLDVTTNELRGKELRWDDKTMAWRPYSTED